MEGFLVFALVALLTLLGVACCIALCLHIELQSERNTRKFLSRWNAQGYAKLNEIRAIIERNDPV